MRIEPAPPEPVDMPAGTLTTLSARVRSHARAYPERTAVIVPRRRQRIGLGGYHSWTYAELVQKLDVVAARFRKAGIRPGDRVAFMVPPGLDAMLAACTLSELGATLVGVEPRAYGLRKTREYLRRVSPHAFVGVPTAHLARVAFGWGRATLRTNIVVGSTVFRGASRESSRPEPRGYVSWPAGMARPQELAAILFTTGSTGAAKPVSVTYAGFAAMLEAVGEAWGLSAERPVVDMPAFPIFWLVALWHGGTVVVPPMSFTRAGPARANPAKLLATIHDCRVSSMFGSPALLANLSRYARRHGKTAPTLERVVVGGAEVSGQLVADLKQLLPRHGEVFVDYGATEVLPIAELAGREIVEDTWPQTQQGRGVCVGRTLDGLQARVIAVHDGPLPHGSQAVPLAAFEVGELVVRGPTVSAAYFDDELNTREHKIADADGSIWHRVGDLAYLDHQRRIWLAGRKAHRVVVGHETLYPLFCEPLFDAHPEVKKSALVAAGGPLNTRAMICIELEHPLKRACSQRVERELLEIARSNQATRSIREVVFIKQLPVDKRHNAKIERQTLRDWLGERERG